MEIKKYIVLAFLIGLALWSIRPFFSSGFFPMHDDAQVARVIVMALALKNGQFPVRMVSDLGYGYGYPLFNFYGPLPYYAGGLFHLLGLDALIATKGMIALGVIIGTVSTYLCSSALFGSLGGLFSAILFTYLPYRAVQIYVRGAVGELWAVSFLPLVMYGCMLLTRRDTKIKGIFLSAFALSGVILSHTVFGYVLTGGVVFGAILLFLVSCVRKKDRIWSFGLSWLTVTLIALGITAFFWIPAFFEMSSTNVSKVIGTTADFKDHFICISQLWDSPWGFGGSAPGCLDGMSFKLGKFHIFSFILAAILWITVREHERRMKSIMGVFMFLFGSMVFLTLQISKPLWDFVPFSSFIQYPWRLLGPIGVFSSLVGGYIFYKKSSFMWHGIFLLFSGSVFLINLKLFTPQYLYYQPVESYASTEELRWRASKVSDEYLPKDLKIPENSNQVVESRVSGNDFVRVNALEETEIKGTYKIVSDGPQKLKLNMAYFPGWTYSINNQQIQPEVVQGQPSVILSSGTSLLEIRFLDTLERKIGNGISCIAIFVTIILVFYGQKNIRHYRHTRL